LLFATFQQFCGQLPGSAGGKTAFRWPTDRKTAIIGRSCSLLTGRKLMREVVTLTATLTIALIMACGGGDEAKDVPAIDASAEDVPAADVPIEEVAPADVSIEDVPAADVPVEEVAEELFEAVEEGTVCVPSCEGVECGDDGCGGICECPGGQQCSDGTCVAPAGVEAKWNLAFAGAGEAVVADMIDGGEGAVFVCGTFSQDEVSFGTAVGNAPAGEDLFLVKLDSDGQVAWAKTYGGTDDDNCQGLADDGGGGVFMVGKSASTDLDLGGGVLANGGNTDILVSRFDGDGNHLWSASYGIDEYESAMDAASDAAGNLYITGTVGGQYSSTVNIGDIPVTTTDKADILVARFDAAGNAVWAKAFGAMNVAHGEKIAVAADGRVVVAGEDFQGGAGFEYGGSEGNLGMGWNVFVLSLDSDGNKLWAKTYGAHGDESSQGLALDDQGNIIFTGQCNGTPDVDFGDGPVMFIGDKDLFVVRLDADGNYLWAKILGTPDAVSSAAGVAVNGSGDIYVTGLFEGATLDLGGENVSTAGGSDIFVARYAPDGNLAWSASFGTAAAEAGVGLLHLPSGLLVLTGSFAGDGIDFGLGTLANSIAATPAVYVAGLEEK